MSLKDGEMQFVSIAGAGVLTGAFVLLFALFTAAEGVAAEPPLKDQEVIEATIAYRKTPQKQPQKKTQNPDVQKPEGVSRDENKKVEDKKDEKKPEKKEDENPFGKFTRPSDDEVGKPTTQPDGDFNGSEKGFAPESKGDPFFGRLRGDMSFTFPEIAKGESIPIGCIRLLADGRIKAFTFDPPGQKGEDDIQIAAEAALKELQKVRTQNPEPVPTHLLSITSKWLCFRFSKPAG